MQQQQLHRLLIRGEKWRRIRARGLKKIDLVSPMGNQLHYFELFSFFVSKFYAPFAELEKLELSCYFYYYFYFYYHSANPEEKLSYSHSTSTHKGQPIGV